jgi:hypothetical protein
MAAAGGHVECVEILVKGRTDSAARFSLAIAEACAGDNTRLLTFRQKHVSLLDQGCPLIPVILRGKCDVALLLIDLGASPRTGPVLAAVVDSTEERLDLVRKLLLDGADANACVPGGASPLHYAARHGHVESIRALIAAGADPTALAKGGEFEGKAPKQVAMAHGREAAAGLLEHSEAVPCVRRPVVLNDRESQASRGNLPEEGRITLDQHGAIKSARREEESDDEA